MEAGTLINGRYRLRRLLGEGAMGTVWEAAEEGSDRWVAIKFLKGRAGESERKRFALEARAMGMLNHPNCLRMHEFGFSEEQKAFYLVMEYLNGVTLGKWMDQPMALADIIGLTSQIATALAYAHHHGVVHRDLKPENVMLVDAVGGEKLVKVLDFGLAKVTDDDQRMTRTGEIFGTPAYMSPEQVRGSRNAGPKSDIYSLGLMMYEMLEHRLPWACETSFDFLTAHVTQPPGKMTRLDVPPELRALVLRMLEKDTNARPSALELWRALQTMEFEASEDSTKFVVVDRDLEHTLNALPAPTLILNADQLDALDDATQHAVIREAGLEEVIKSSGDFEFKFEHAGAARYTYLVPKPEPEDAPLELAEVVPPPTQRGTVVAPPSEEDEKVSVPFAIGVLTVFVLFVLGVGALLIGPDDSPVDGPLPDEVQPVDAIPTVAEPVVEEKGPIQKPVEPDESTVAAKPKPQTKPKKPKQKPTQQKPRDVPPKTVDEKKALTPKLDL